MSLESLLEKNRKRTLNKWFDLIVRSYPKDTQSFLKSQSDPFANPVGGAILEGTNALYDHLVAGTEECEAVGTFLDRIIRVRAVQEFSPAEAIGFVFLLKQSIREELGREIKQSGHFEELLTFESRIDNLALLSFNIYMECREKLFQLRADELRRGTARIVERACRIWDAQGQPSNNPEKE